MAWESSARGSRSWAELFFLTEAVLEPNQCSAARAAYLELLRWKEHCKRLLALDEPPPAVALVYRAVNSIFHGVFDKASPQLNQKWVAKLNELGLPDRPTMFNIQPLVAFAEAELENMVLKGSDGSNTVLPRTEREKQFDQRKLNNARKAADANAKAAMAKMEQQAAAAVQKATTAAATAAAASVPPPKGPRKSRPTRPWVK